MLIQVVVVLVLVKVAEPVALGVACPNGNGDCTGDTPGQYSVCDGSTVCACQAGYADDGGGVCQPDIGSACGASSECMAGAGGTNSECSTNCVCSNTYSNVGGVCKADLGTACVAPSDCGDSNAACTGSVCVCAATYYDDDGTSTAGGTCTAGLALNAACSGPAAAVRDAACQAINTETTCVTSGGSSLCTCNSGFYDNDGVGTPGGSCVAGIALNTACSGVAAAAQNAACVAGLTNTMCDGTNCVCATGYTESGGACKADLGTACGAASDCEQSNAACTGSVCVCASTYYDDDGTSTAGGACIIGLDLNADCSGPATAVRDAACQAKNTETMCVTSGGSTLCTCNSGYYDDDGVGTAGGSCVAVLTTSCTDETNCGDVDANAECTGTVGSKTCNCKSGYTGASGDVCQVQSAGEHNTASFWLCAGLLLLAAKRVLL